MKAIDLFAGAGGFSTGAVMAGLEVVWAANHWPAAVEIHAANHPRAKHVTQDLHQANWSQVPAHDILLAAPCCQGHSRARGKAANNPQHDASRSTAWAVVSALEYHRPAVGVIENVVEFIQWKLYPAWRSAVHALGYQVAPHVVDAADHGVPQHRKRLILILTRSAHPLMLQLPQREHVSAAQIIDFNTGKWSPIEKSGRSLATLRRIANGRRAHGDRFVAPYYGSGSGETGRSLARPLGTITTRDRWAVIDGDRMRMITKDECRDAMSFPSTYVLPKQHRLAVHMLGNAVPPYVARDVLQAIKAAA
ncbi:DNA methyltransferase [Burkholderia stagnalis]|uniref:DNA cytosine methyltransferase n=1 Tax=Burkholderia stagnalis TaxID=1503054 RepID=UPI000756B5C6|nr:DNA cytosine methyltransferase [Burkholderia stagnalis]KVN73862.1 DNA methyltransferase [Burkholderia stagnalis]KWO27034.1 DNA methyltransferase [Burkholderia stagnalis]KWO45032.1 DNA methyltransferase [Burkholderia stagnalis]